MLRLLLPLAALATLLTACRAPEDNRAEIETGDIVASIPWPDSETARYRLVDDDGEQQGTGVISVEREGETYVLRFSYDSGETTDETVAEVDAATLKPRTVRRTIVSPDQTTEFTAAYAPDEDVVSLTQKVDGDEKKNPLRLPDHYYDNESSFFLWRAIDMREDYEGAYNAVLSTHRRTATVAVRVAGRETVEVPAGTFDAWRIEVSDGEVTLFAWYADTPERPLVRYENPELDLHYLLEELE